MKISILALVYGVLSFCCWAVTARGSLHQLFASRHTGVIVMVGTSGYKAVWVLEIPSPYSLHQYGPHLGTVVSQLHWFCVHPDPHTGKFWLLELLRESTGKDWRDRYPDQYYKIWIKASGPLYRDPRCTASQGTFTDNLQLAHRRWILTL